MKLYVFSICILMQHFVSGQSSENFPFHFQVTNIEETDAFFTNNSVWRGADGASSIDLENGNILWLFSDSFISSDGSGTRNNSTIIRNSIGIQHGYDLKTANITFYWNDQGNNPGAFFHQQGDFWYWTGHGTMIKDKLLVFLIKVENKNNAIGFEATGWAAVLISNPYDTPSEWDMHYINGIETYGIIAGSAAVLKNENYIYAFSVSEPDTHEVFLLRWKIDAAYLGDLHDPEWLINGQWVYRTAEMQTPSPLFIGQTEFSVHYDPGIKKYIQIQTYGFGKSEIGIRLSDSLEGKWMEPVMIYKPDFPAVNDPLIYAAKAHPELLSDGIYITYNVNSFDFMELLKNNSIYFPKFIALKIITE